MSTVQYRKWAEEWWDWEDIQRCASDNGLIWSEEQCKDFLDEHEYELAEKMKESSYELAEELICEIVAIEEDEAEDEEYDFDDDDDSQDSCTISPESYEFLENRLGNQYYHNRNIRRKPNTGSQYLIDDSETSLVKKTPEEIAEQKQAKTDSALRWVEQDMNTPITRTSEGRTELDYTEISPMHLTEEERQGNHKPTKKDLDF